MAAPNLHVFPNNCFMDLTIYQFGHQNCPPLHTFGPAIRNHFLFHYVLSGKGVFYGENENKQATRFEILPGQGFMIWPKQITSYNADIKEPWVYMWVEFDGLKANEIVSESGLTPNNPIYMGKGDMEQSKMENALKYIAHNPKAPTFELIGHCYLFLNSLAASSLCRKKIARSSLQDFYVREAVLFIENHFREDMHIEDIAASCNIDRSHLGKIFKNAMGMGLKDFLIHYRVNKACELLKGTNHTISEIANMTGYSNLFNFSRAFKTVMGIAPRQWRDKNKLFDNSL